MDTFNLGRNNANAGALRCGYCVGGTLGSLGYGEHPMTEPTPDEVDPTTVEIDLEIHDITQSTEVE